MKNTKNIKSINSSKATITKIMLLSMLLAFSHANIDAVYGLPDLSRLLHLPAMVMDRLSLHDSFTYLCQNGYTKTVQFLLKYQPNFNTSYVDSNGNGPLIAAASQGHIEIVKLLLENDCYPNHFDKNGHGPLHHAALHGHYAIVKMLIEHHADPRKVNMNWVMSSECQEVLQDAQKQERWNTRSYNVGYEAYKDAQRIKEQKKNQRRLERLHKRLPGVNNQRLFGNYDIRLADYKDIT